MFVLFLLGIVVFGPFVLAFALMAAGLVISFALSLFTFIGGLVFPILKWICKLIWRIFHPFKWRTS